MNLAALQAYLDRIGVSDDDYVLGDLGTGEVPGVGFLKGAWSTYYSQRGEYSNVVAYADEHAACRAFAQMMRDMVQRETGVHHELPAD